MKQELLIVESKKIFNPSKLLEYNMSISDPYDGVCDDCGCFCPCLCGCRACCPYDDGND